VLPQNELAQRAYRMYYKAWQLTVEGGKLTIPHATFGAYAESKDADLYSLRFR